MALSVKVGSFDTGTGAVSSNVVVTGVGFQPSVVFFWWSGRTGSSDAVGSAHIQRGQGVAISATSRRAVATRSEDAATTSDTSRAGYDAACVVVMSPTSAAIDGLLDFVSFDSDGFTLVVDDQFTASYRIHYKAIGGADLTNAFLGTLSTAAGIGDESYTGVGFQPDFLWFMSHNSNSLNSVQGGAEMCLGAAVSSSQQAVWYGDSIASVTTMDSMNYCRAGECYANGASGAMTIRASLVSMDADGFTLTFGEVAAATTVFYLALKGGRYAVGDLLTATDTNNFSESGLSVGTPVGLLFVSAGKAADSSDTPSAHDRWSMGAATSASERAAMATLDEDATADAECATAVEHDACYINIDTSDTVVGLMDLVSMDSDGFTVVMDDADPSQAFVWFVAFGSNAGGGGSVNTQTLSSTLVVIDEPLDYVFHYRLGEDTLSIFDELVTILVGTNSRILTDTLTIDDGAVLFYRRNRLLADAIVVTEGTLEQYIISNVVMDETLDVVDALIRYAQFTRLGTDSLVITDSLISAVVNYVVNTATLSSAIEVTDSASWYVYVTRLVESALSVFDESQSQLLRFILLTDALWVDDAAESTYVPDPGPPAESFNPVMRIGTDQPKMKIGGYRIG